MANTKLKMGQAVNTSTPGEEDEAELRRRENRNFFTVVLGVPIVLTVVIYLIWQFKLLG